MSNKHSDIWQCPGCGTLIDLSSVGLFVEVACPQCGHTEQVHSQIANYRLTGVLGVGGMSIVYKAKDVILDRATAVKVLNDTYKDQPERIERFENECAMMAKVRHENVVSVYSAGTAHGQFYIAMELVAGRDLESIVAKFGVLTPVRALYVTRQIICGLDAAHRAGLLHRDMKPGNVLIAKSDGKAKVLDFGLALGTQTEDSESVIWATPFYVPPETLRREHEDVRTDIYALGMTLRFLLTGVHKLPDDPQDLQKMLDAKEKLPRFATVMPKAERALCELVDHMTAFDIHQRPPSYAELLQELEEVLAIYNEKAEAVKPENVRRAKRLRNRCIFATLFLGCALGGLMGWMSIPAPVRPVLPAMEVRHYGDLTLFEDSLKALRADDRVGALNGLKQLCDGGHERGMSATAALLCMFMADIENNAELSEQYLAAFRTIIQEKENVSPAALELFAQLPKVSEALDSGTPLFTLNKEVPNAGLRGIIFTHRAAKSIRSGNRKMTERNLADAATSFQADASGYSFLSQYLLDLQKLP